MESIQIAVTAIISAAASAAVAYSLGRRQERREVRREAANDLERELEDYERTIRGAADWFRAWNDVLDLRNRYEHRLRHKQLEERLYAITKLAYHLHLDLEEEVPEGHRLPSASSMYLAITSAREGLTDFLHNRQLSEPKFPTGDRLDALLAEWRETRRRPAGLRPG
jgi:hypothetical protein